MRECLLLIHIVITLLLAGCGSSTQEDFANRIGQAMRAPANDPTTASSLGSLRRVAMSAATTDATSITPDQLFDWAEATYPQFFPTREKTLTWSVYQFRYYKDTDVYLAVESGTKVVALGKPTGGSLLELGALGQYGDSVRDYKLIAKSKEVVKINNTFSVDFEEYVNEVYFVSTYDVDQDGVDDFVISASIEPYAQVGVACCEVSSAQVKSLRGVKPKLYLSNAGRPLIVDFPDSAMSHRTWAGQFFELNGSLFYLHGRNGELGLPDQNVGERSQIYKVTSKSGQTKFSLVAEMADVKTTASTDIQIKNGIAEIIQNNYNTFNSVGSPIYRTEIYQFDGSKVTYADKKSFLMKDRIAHNQIIYSRFLPDHVITSTEAWKSYDGSQQITTNPASYIASSKKYIDLLPVLYENNHSGASIAELKVANQIIVLEVATEFFGHQGGGFKGAKIAAYKVDLATEAASICDQVCSNLSISLPGAIGGRFRYIDLDFDGIEDLYFSRYSKGVISSFSSKNGKIAQSNIANLVLADVGGWMGTVNLLKDIKNRCVIAVSGNTNFKATKSVQISISECSSGPFFPT